jgi:hypothetical protein
MPIKEYYVIACVVSKCMKAFQIKERERERESNQLVGSSI